MSGQSGPIRVEVVKIRILKSGSQSWYADQVGKTVRAFKEISVDANGKKWTSYKQYPRPRGFEPSGHYTGYDVEEVSQ